MKKLLFFFIILLLIGFAGAETSIYVPKSQVYDLQFKCTDDSQPLSICSVTTQCNITIQYPNGSILINNSAASNLHNGKFNFTLNENQTTPSGEYYACIGCSSSTLNASSCFIYEVNLAGIRTTESRTQALTRSIYFMFGIGIILFLAFLFVKNSIPVKWTFFILAIIFFLISINLLFVGLQDEAVNPKLESFFDGFTAISFIIYWFAAGLLGIMWFLTFLQTWFYKKNIKNIQRFG